MIGLVELAAVNLQKSLRHVTR